MRSARNDINCFKFISRIVLCLIEDFKTFISICIIMRFFGLIVIRNINFK